MKFKSSFDEPNFIIYAYGKEEKERIENIIKKYGYHYKIKTNTENVDQFCFVVIFSESSDTYIILDEFKKEVFGGNKNE